MGKYYHIKWQGNIVILLQGIFRLRIPNGRVFKINNYFCMIFDRFIKIFHAPSSLR